MKKSILITLGVLIILLVVGVWVYLIMFSTPKNAGEVFTNLGFSQNTEVDPNIVETLPGTVDTASTDGEGAPQPLKQLIADRAVAGAVFVDDSIRFVERGTGHVFDIVLATGELRAVSGTTVPRTVDAIFSDDGSRVALTYEDSSSQKTTLLSLVPSGGESSPETTGLPPSARNISFNGSDVVRYVEVLEGGVVGVHHDLSTEKTTKTFTSPLKQVSVAWGSDATYLYTTPTQTQYGYVYRAGGTPEYVSNGGFGLMAIPFVGGVVVSQVIDERLVSGAVLHSSTPLPLSLFPEKCVENPQSGGATLYCAAVGGVIKGAYPDNWYKGLVSLRDSLWIVDPVAATTTLLSDMSVVSGRDVDTSKIGANSDGTLIYLINKNDGSLWLFDTTLQTQNPSQEGQEGGV